MQREASALGLEPISPTRTLHREKKRARRTATSRHVNGNSDESSTPPLHGVHGNYIATSIARPARPHNLPESDPSKMSFGGDGSKKKAWKDIWGSGQGIGAVKKVVPTRELVQRLADEYTAARRRLALA